MTPTSNESELGDERATDPSGREHPRAPWHKRATLRLGDGEHSVQSGNISLGGLLVTGLPFSASAGQEGRLCFTSDADVEAALGVSIENVWLHVRVMWHLKGLTGLAFTKPDENETQWVQALCRVAAATT